MKADLVTLDNDAIFPVLDGVYSGKIGPAYTDAQLDDLHKKGKDRFGRNMPPGFLDKKEKPEPQCYGDYVWWSQLLDHNGKAKKPVVIVTSESGEDWWHIASGKTIGPRYELIAEMLKQSGQKMLMYNPSTFLTYYQQFTQKPIDAQVLKEVEAVSQRRLYSDEDLLRLVQSMDAARLKRIQRPTLVGMKYVTAGGIINLKNRDLVRIRELLAEGKVELPSSEPRSGSEST